ELAHRRGIGPGRPFGIDAGPRRKAEERGAALARVGERHCPCGGDGFAVDRRERHCRVVDDAAGDHVDHVGVERAAMGGEIRNAPGKLLFARKPRGGRMNLHQILFHLTRTMPFVLVVQALARRRRMRTGASRKSAAITRKTTESGVETSTSGLPWPAASAVRSCCSAMGPKISPISTGAMGKS